MRIGSLQIILVLFLFFSAASSYGANSIHNVYAIENPTDSTSIPSEVVPDSIQMRSWRSLFSDSVGLKEGFELPFSLKYCGIITRSIVYTPSQVVFKGTEKPSLMDSLFYALQSDFVDLKCLTSMFVIENPSKVSFLWKDIPEPSKLLERGYMRRKSAEEEMQKMLPKTNDEGRKTLTIKKLTISPWKFTGVEYLQFQQVGQSNWKKGGESNIAFMNDLRLKLIYKLNKVEWESFVVSKMGVTFDKKADAKLNDDVLELNTKFGYKAAKNWFYSASSNFKTQLFYDSYTDGAGRKIYTSGFLSPGYYTAALGMDYKRGNSFSILLSPLTAKITFLTDTININPKDYDILPGEKAKRQVGFSVNSTFKIPITNLIIYQGRVELFKDYLEKAHSWFFDMENILDLRINRYLTARINAEWRYSGIESDALQFKENVQVGFTYNF